MYVLNIPTILVDVGGKKRRYFNGDDLKDVPDDQLEAMLRLKQAVECSPAVAETLKPEPPAEDAAVNAGDWRTQPVAVLELDQATRKVLIENGLGTVQAILDYGQAHGDLSSIDGIGEGREKAIQAALTKAAGQS